MSLRSLIDELKKAVGDGKNTIQFLEDSLKELKEYTFDHPDIHNDVSEFHIGANQPIAEAPKLADNKRRDFRLSMIIEEYRELYSAMQNGDILKIADGGVDLIYVILGMFLEYGIPFAPVWNEIHRSNMNKMGGPVRDDGKQLKPEGWVPPDIEAAVYGPDVVIGKLDQQIQALESRREDIFINFYDQGEEGSEDV